MLSFTKPVAACGMVSTVAVNLPANPSTKNMGKTQQWLIISLVSLASFMGMLDGTIVNISLPTISKYFKCDIATVSWVAMIYLLVLSSTLITFGRVGDFRGYKKIYLLGFAIFTIGSLCCGLSSRIYFLIGFRALQAIGAAMLQAIGGAMIIRYLPEKSRGMAIGIMTTFAAVGLAIGTPLGGFLSQNLSWHWIFFVNVPVGVLAVILGIVVLPRDVAEPHTGRFDLSGAGLLLVALGSLIFFLSMGNNVGWSSWVVITSMCLCFGAWTGFIINERKSHGPLIELNLFKDRNFTIASVVALSAFVIGQGSWYILPFYLELQKKLTPDIAGLVLLVPSASIMVSGPVAGILSDRIGSRPICVVASFAIIAAFAMFTLMGSNTSLTFIILALLFQGIGLGLIVPANFNLIMRSSSRGDEGMINSLVTTLRNMGAVIGIALFGLIFLTIVASSGISPSGALPHDIPDNTRVPGFHATFFFGLIIAIVLLILNLALREQKTKHDR